MSENVDTNHLYTHLPKSTDNIEDKLRDDCLVEEEDDDPTNNEEYSIMLEKRPCWKRYFGPIGDGSLRGSTIAMASITFGGGCLAFPNAVAQCGPIVALIIFSLIAAASFYTLWILLEDGMKARIMDYNGLIQKTMGNKMVIFSDINNMILCLGVIMSYQLTVYNFAMELLKDVSNIEDNKFNRLIVQLICTICIQLPLNTLKNISALQYASIVGTIALIYSIFVIVVECPFYFISYIEQYDFPSLFKPLNWGYLDTISTFMFGFASHNGIFQVFVELKRPSSKRYHKILERSFVIELVLYLSIAYCGYFSTFDKTKDIFLYRDDLEDFKPDYFMKIAKFTLFICLHCTMAINYNIMRMSFKSMIFNGKEIHYLKDFLIVLITYIISNIGVFFVRSVANILGVIGGICTVVICFMNPILIRIKLSNLPNMHPNNLIRYTILFFISLFGTMATVKSLIDIITKKN